MTVDPPVDSSPTEFEPITDPDSLRSEEEIEFHDDTDVIPAETVEQLPEADDMAIVGVENDDFSVPEDGRKFIRIFVRQYITSLKPARSLF